MAHVPGAEAAMKAATTAQSVAGKMGPGTMGPGMASMMGPNMMGSGMANMMGPGMMGPGMENMMGPGMMGMMGEGHMMANMPMMSSGAAQMAKGAMTAGAMGAAMSASRNPRGILGTLARHPLLVFGLGVAAGVLIYKYRKEIIGCASGAAEKGKDFVLQQRENLEDLVAESRESAQAQTVPQAERPRAGRAKTQE